MEKALQIEVYDEVKVHDEIVSPRPRYHLEPDAFISADHFPMPSTVLTWPPAMARAPSLSPFRADPAAVF